MRKIACGAKRKEKKEKNKRREETVYKISESEPSEREARETCERMRKMVSSKKAPAPALMSKYRSAVTVDFLILKIGLKRL